MNTLKSPDISGLSFDDQPIAALSSGSGACAVALIRLTGRHCHQLVKTVLASVIKNKSCEEFKARVFYLCDFHRVNKPDDVLDQPLVVFFDGPKSFTGQDCCEIHLHGGPYIVQETLSTLFEIGFRPAEPGEFTKRAFLNGKLDLTAAEGIKELVEAQSHQQWLSAKQLASGKLLVLINSMRKKLIEAQAFLEASIDFPDEGDTASVNLSQAIGPCKEVLQLMTALLNSYDSGRVASNGLRVALLGPPNSGKSSLMNLFLGEDRAIVTDEAGTTRDYLEERCLLGGRLIQLIDTAGIRQSNQKVEKIGIERSLEIAKDSDVILCLLSADTDETEGKKVLQWASAHLSQKEIIFVKTKSDLGQDLDTSLLSKDMIEISTVDDSGIKELTTKIVSFVDSHVELIKENPFIATVRQKNALSEAGKFMDGFFTAADAGEFEECLAFELQGATRALGAIIGAVDHEDVLDVVFSSFCIGK